MTLFDQFYGLPGTAERSENERGGLNRTKGKLIYKSRSFKKNKKMVIFEAILSYSFYNSS